VSLDGYIEDEDGKFDWAQPGEKVHSFINDLERPVGTHLYGRRMYETLVAWETLSLAEQPSYMREFAEIWRAADKIVYSRTLKTASSARTKIERDFDPEAVRQLKTSADRDISVGGPGLAAQAIKAGLVDEYHLFVAPIVVGGGKQSLPDDVHLELELLDERRFGNGMVHLRYGARPDVEPHGNPFQLSGRSGCQCGDDA
jgi:dihydrofolate reductase